MSRHGGVLEEGHPDLNQPSQSDHWARGISEQHDELGKHRVLKRSSSISSSSTRNASAMPRLPAPLLPTVRRLSSSPASSKSGRRDIGEEQAMCMDGAASESKRPKNMEVLNGNHSEQDAQTSTPIFSRRCLDGRVEAPATVEGIGYDNSNADEHRSNVGNSQEFERVCWAQPPQANELGFSDRISGFSNLRDKPHVATVAKLPQHRSLAAGFAVEKFSSKVQSGGQFHNSRRRRLPRDSHSRPSFNEWLNEVRWRPRTSPERSNWPSSLFPNGVASKLVSFVRWPSGQNNRLSSCYLAINLLMIICFSLLLYSVAQHQHVVRLQIENAMLKDEVSIHHNNFVCREGKYEFEQSSSQIEANLDLPSYRNTWKLLFCVLVLLACGSFMAKCSTGLLIKGGSTEDKVPFGKHVAYFIDVLFSTHPYAKSVALLLATLLLIGFGGFSLYAVSDISLTDALWRSWTYVADSGNHADSIGVGPRIVAASISIGGMLIFALMLGLISDAIYEKVDSLRRGKSEVLERNHTLILGWSDKLGSLSEAAGHC